MSWSLSASGHTAAKEIEEKLHAELKEVLSKPEFGAMNSWFGGSHVQSHLHATREPAEHEGA